MLHLFNLRAYKEEELTDTLLDGVIANVGFAMHVTYHTAINASPSQVIFGCDMIFPMRYVANWKDIQQCQKERIREDNERENRNRVHYNYEIGNQVFIRRGIKFRENVPKLVLHDQK